MTSARESSVPPYGPAGPGMRSRSGQLAGAASRAVPAVGLVGGAVFVASQLNHGWVPWDDGTLAQSAQRVLLGELPHRDFAELYTGGLSFLNAGVLWLTGGNLFWLRAPMLLLFLAYLSCVYLVARRFASPTVATLAALFAVAWGPPVYPAAMPSWYGLYLAVIGAYFLVRHHETGRRGWLFAAGVAGGLSICCKITGVWYVLAVALYLVYRAQERPAESRARHEGSLARASRRVVFAAIPAPMLPSSGRAACGEDHHPRQGEAERPPCCGAQCRQLWQGSTRAPRTSPRTAEGAEIGRRRDRLRALDRLEGAAAGRALAPPQPPRRSPPTATSGPAPAICCTWTSSRYARFLRPGHRVTGDRSQRSRDWMRPETRVGYDYAHAIVDDHSRLAYVELHDDERAATVTGFVERALAFFAEHGIIAKRLMTDNGFSYVKNRSLRELLARRGIRHLTTKPYRPRTNGKVERFHQTMAREWAYGLAYRSHRQRNQALPHWLDHYNRAQAAQLARRPATDQPRSQRPWVGQLGSRPGLSAASPAPRSAQAHARRRCSCDELGRRRTIAISSSR